MRLALDRPPFRPRFPWWSGNLQSLATAILPVPKDMAPHASDVLRLPLPDGDVLQAALDSPVTPKPGRPAVLLIHGAGGSAASPYMLRASRTLLDLGHRVVRLNLRGAGPSRPDCRGQYYAGGSADLASVLAVLPDRLAKDGLMKDGLVAVGYSVGGSILLKSLGSGRRLSRPVLGLVHVARLAAAAARAGRPCRLPWGRQPSTLERPRGRKIPRPARPAHPCARERRMTWRHYPHGRGNSRHRPRGATNGPSTFAALCTILPPSGGTGTLGAVHSCRDFARRTRYND